MPLLPDWGDIAGKYDSLYRQTQDLEQYEIQELLLAFGAGMLSLVSALTAVRVLSLVRSRGYRAVGEEASRALSFAGFSRSSNMYGRMESRSRTLPLRTGASRLQSSGWLDGPQRYQQISEIPETELPLMDTEQDFSDAEVCD